MAATEVTESTGIGVGDSCDRGIRLYIIIIISINIINHHISIMGRLIERK